MSAITHNYTTRSLTIGEKINTFCLTKEELLKKPIVELDWGQDPYCYRMTETYDQIEVLPEAGRKLNYHDINKLVIRTLPWAIFHSSGQIRNYTFDFFPGTPGSSEITDELIAKKACTLLNLNNGGISLSYSLQNETHTSNTKLFLDNNWCTVEEFKECLKNRKITYYLRAPDVIPNQKIWEKPFYRNIER